MAYYSEPEKDEEDTSQGMNVQEGQAPSSQPVQLTTPSSISSSAGSTSKSAAPKSASSGSGPSFQNYAKANQGKAQENLNSDVAKNVAKAGQVATNTINQSTTQFGKRVEQGSLANRENAVQDVSNVTNAARNIQAGAGVDDEQKKRFQEVINARYQGPESLRQAGLYQIAADKTGAAQTAIDRTGTAAGREDLLKNMYEKRGAYNTGLNKLDSALLNASQQGVQNLQNVAKAQGNIGQKLDQAQIGSANLAGNRTKEIKGIQEQARTSFSEGKKAEEAATEERLSTVIKDWDKLPEYYRDIIRNKEKNNIAMANEEVNSFTNLPQNKEVVQKYQAAVAPLVNEKNQIESFLSSARPEAEKAATQNRMALDMRSITGMTDQQVLSDKYYQANQAKIKQITDYENRLNQIDNTINTSFPQELAAYQKYQSDLQAMQQRAANPNLDQIGLNSFEAAVLGVNSGEGLYNLGENAIKTSLAEKDRLVSRNEQARQAVLAQLAGLDQSNRLDTNLLYGDADRAGTQSILDSLDVQGTRNALNEAETGFRDTSNATNLTGTGSKKVSRGNAFGKKTKTYSASVGGNVGDFLRSGGYDTNAALATGTNYGVSGGDLLGKYLDATNTQRNNSDLADASGFLEGTVAAGGAGASIGSAGGPVGALVGGIAGSALGGTLQSGTVDPLQQATDLLRGYAPGVGQVVGDVRTGAGKAAEAGVKYNPITGLPDAFLGGALSKGIGGMVGGIDSGAMKAYGDSIAKQQALNSLQSQYRGYLENQGFDNRFNVSDNMTTTSRMTALQQLLDSLDKTNT